MLAAGAAAARIGTRFLATPEADVHPAYQAAVLSAAAEDTELTDTFSVLWPDAPHRVLRASIDAALTATENVVGAADIGGAQIPIPRLDPQAPTRATTGNVAAMPWYAGQGVGTVTQVRPAADVVHELVDSAAELLATHEVRAADDSYP